MLSFGQPWLLLLGPLAVALLYLLERWRQRPLEVVVADLELFQPSAEAEAEARSRRRRVQLSWLLRAAAALLLAAAAADPSLPPGPGGPLTVDLVLDRGLESGAREGSTTRLDRGRAELQRVLDALRPDDRVRLHLTPGPVPAPASPADARAALARVAPTGARGDPAGVVARLARRARAGGPPVFLACAEPLALPAAQRDAVALAAGGGAVGPDRAVLALLRADGALHVTLGARGAGGEVTLTLAARGADGRVVTRARRLTLPEGLTTARWTAAEGFPADATEASARLTPEDALPTNDRAFAALTRARPRVVGVVEDADPPVLRALRAVRGVELRRLTSLPQGEAARAYDLLVAPELPRQLPPCALIVVPLELPDATVAGGALAGRAQPGFEHTLRQLAREPEAAAAQLGPLPSDLRAAAPLLLAGGEPFAVVRGARRQLLAFVRAPLRDEATTWPRLPSFPVFWAELLERAAPRAVGGLEAHVAGEPWRGQTPLEVRRYLDADGQLVLGTVAAPLGPPSTAPAASSRFAAADLARLGAARPRTQRPSLAPLLALLALLLAAAAWLPPRETPVHGATRSPERAAAGSR